MYDLKNVFEDRRAINHFDSTKNIEQGVLENIINLAVLAPSAFNLQPWEIIVVKSDEAKKKLCALSSNQPKVLEAPVTLIIVGDRAGYESSNPVWAELEMAIGKDSAQNAQKFASILYGSTPERKIKFAESNVGYFAMAIMYAAKYYGVDSHPMSGIDFEGIKNEFNITGERDVVLTISLGYFDTSKTLHPRSKRKGYNEIVREV